MSWSPGPQGAQINEAACDLAREVADEGDALVAGGVSQTPSYLSCKSDADVKAIFKKQLDVFVKKNVDFLIAEVRCPATRKKTLDMVRPEGLSLESQSTKLLPPPPSKNLRHMRLSGSVVMQCW